MDSPAEVIRGLQFVKKAVQRHAWALGLHIPGGISGGRNDVEREAETMVAWIDSAIDRITADADAQ